MTVRIGRVDASSPAQRTDVRGPRGLRRRKLNNTSPIAKIALSKLPGWVQIEIASS